MTGSALVVSAGEIVTGTRKGFRSGSHRLVSPAETLRRVTGLSGPMGITRVANVTGLDCIGIPVFQACRPNARSVSVSQGKGTTMEAAKASAIMEAVELFHAERVSAPLRLSSWRELGLTHCLAAVESLPRISFRALDPDRALLWIEGYDLLSAEPTWVPYEMVHMDYTLPLPTGAGCFAMGSNGLASGNHRLEAVCHALYELIERDATALFRLLPENAQERRRLNLDSVVDPDARWLLGAYARAGIAVSVWDITSDIGVPAFLCRVADRDPSTFRQLPVTEGAGCHAVREISIVRALTEAAQARLTFIAGSRDDIGRHRHARHRATGLDGKEFEHLLSNGGAAFEQVPTRQGETFEDDLRGVLSALQSVGLEQVVVVDLMKPELEIPVVRVVVPGLETHHRIPGYVPGVRAQRVLQTRAGGGDAWM